MILSIGEILADLIGEENDGIMRYSRYPGGAPLNVAFGIKKLNGKVGFIGSVGDDIIGNFLYDFVKKVDFNYLDVTLSNEHNTTLAFVDIKENGERDFKFNRFNSADYYINYNRLDIIKDFNIIHFGSLMLRENEGIKLADKICEISKEHNKLLSFDINFRSDIYKSKEEAIKIYSKYIKLADILKFSEEEVELFSNEKDIITGLNKITKNNQMVFVTLGSKGSLLKYKENVIYSESIKINPIDTTGAGDAFYASILTSIDELNMDKLSDDEIKNILYKANISGALACLKKGAISSFSTADEIDKYIKKEI